MRKMFCLVLLFSCFATSFTEGVSVSDDNQIAPIRESLSRNFCYEVYWEAGANYKLGSSLQVEMKFVGEKFLVWINNMEMKGPYHVAGFYTGRLKDEKGVIIRRESYNIDLKPHVPGYSENRSLFEKNTVIKDTIIIPSDCTPHYDPQTPKKELMLRTVVSTVQKQLNRWGGQGIVKYPHELTLVIADFNIDYPSTYVLVEQTKNLYSVTLHDPQNYDSDEYERNGEYPLGEVYNQSKTKSLIAKVRKHGIIQKIVLVAR